MTLKAKKVNWNNVLSIVLLFILVFCRVPFLMKGIDYTDTGFSLENYFNVYGGKGIQEIGVFYTTAIGGLVYKLLPAYQLLVFRILHWLLNLGTYLFAYLIFKDRVNRNVLLFIFVILSLGAKGGEALFSYYPLSAFMLLLSVWLLYEGIKKDSNIRIAFSAFVTGLNCFVRLPNLLFFSAFFGLVFYCVFAKLGKKSVKPILSYIIGALVSLIFSVAVMSMFMGFDGVIKSFLSYLNLALGKSDGVVENILNIEEHSGHSLTSEIITIGIQCVKSIITIIMCLIPALVIFWLVKYFSHKFIKSEKRDLISYIIATAVSGVFLFLLRGQLSGTITFVLYLYGFLLTVIATFFFKKQSPQDRALVITAALVGFFSMFGSDGGIARMQVANTLLLPIIFVTIGEMDIGGLSWNFLNKKYIVTFFKYTTFIVLIACTVVRIFVAIPSTYNDADYCELNYSVNEDISVLKGMKTSKQRAEQINEYYEIMQSPELKDKQVAIFGYFPLGITLTEQRDYFETVQPCIDYSSVSVTSLLSCIKMQDERGVVPVIVVSYVDVIQRGKERDDFTTVAKHAVFDYMLEKNEYKVAHKSEYFTVYAPVEEIKG